MEALAERLHELRRELSLCGSKMTRINARRAIQAAGAASRGTLSTGSIGRHATLLDAWRLHEELDRLVWRQPEQCVRQLGRHARLLPQLHQGIYTTVGTHAVHLFAAEFFKEKAQQLWIVINNQQPGGLLLRH